MLSMSRVCRSKNLAFRSIHASYDAIEPLSPFEPWIFQNVFREGKGNTTLDSHNSSAFLRILACHVFFLHVQGYLGPRRSTSHATALQNFESKILIRARFDFCIDFPSQFWIKKIDNFLKKKKNHVNWPHLTMWINILIISGFLEFFCRLILIFNSNISQF